ncbi:hypothetical protein CB1_000327020 [Camelus ferus]|nr:hypothetical protein CB1_000327020 [Camelus ferus]
MLVHITSAVVAGSARALDPCALRVAVGKTRELRAHESAQTALCLALGAPLGGASRQREGTDPRKAHELCSSESVNLACEQGSFLGSASRNLGHHPGCPGHHGQQQWDLACPVSRSH